jgi:hypothetical protein
MFLNLPNRSRRNMALGLTQPLTEMSTTNLPGGKGRPVRRADNLTAICEQIATQKVAASTSHNPMGFHGLLHGYLYLFLQKNCLWTSLTAKNINVDWPQPRCEEGVDSQVIAHTEGTQIFIVLTPFPSFCNAARARKYVLRVEYMYEYIWLLNIPQSNS